MPRIYSLYLRDILKAIGQIEHYLVGVNKAVFKQDQLRIDGVLYNLMIIGEAIKNIPEEMRAQNPEVRWRDISRFRDRVVHHYFTTDMDIVWEIVSVQLPILRDQTEKILQSRTQDEDSQS